MYKSVRGTRASRALIPWWLDARPAYTVGMTGLRLTRAARERYGLYVTELPGQIAEIRRFLATLQRQAGTEAFQGVHAGQLQAAWLITSALSLVVDRYEQDIGRDTFNRALGAVAEALGQ